MSVVSGYLNRLGIHGLLKPNEWESVYCVLEIERGVFMIYNEKDGHILDAFSVREWNLVRLIPTDTCIIQQ